MSQAHAQTYYELVAKDPALLESLGDGTQSADEFIARAVAAAKQQGLEFTAEEAKTYVASQEAEKTGGELSDQQLEAVAGGKNSSQSNTKRNCASNLPPTWTFGFSWWG